MAKISDIRAALKTTFESIGSISFVSDVIDAQVEWFPALSFEPDKLDSSSLDSCNNQRDYVFKVVLEVESNIKTRDQALNLLIDCFDDVLNAIDIDYTLWGLCEWWVDPVSADFVMAKVEESWAVLAVIFDIHCKTLKNIKM